MAVHLIRPGRPRAGHPDDGTALPERSARTRRTGARAAVVALALVAGIATIPATALAGSWGPKYSYYNGISRVVATGTMTRYDNRSRSVVNVCDGYNEGWPVYGYSDWTDLGNANSRTSRSTGQTGGCISGDWSVGWWNVNGFWVRAQGCAQVGWPVPDSCTSWNSEAHRP